MKKFIFDKSADILREDKVEEDLINEREITYFETIRNDEIIVVLSIVSIINDSIMCEKCSELFFIIENEQDNNKWKVVYRTFAKGVFRAPSLISVIGHIDINNDGFDEVVLSRGAEWGKFYKVLSRKKSKWVKVYKSPEYDSQ